VPCVHCMRTFGTLLTIPIALSCIVRYPSSTNNTSLCPLHSHVPPRPSLFLNDCIFGRQR
jgi:hypothetical protein